MSLSASMKLLVFTIFILCELKIEQQSFQVGATLSKSKKNKETCRKGECKEKKQNLVGPSEQSVFSNNLVSKSIKYQDVLKYNKAYFDDVYDRKFMGDVLGYVTPWNNHGYDIAKTFPKFTMISPVWLQVQQSHPGVFKIRGQHDMDQGWIKDVRKVNHMAKIMPRLLFDRWTMNSFEILFSRDDFMYKFVDVIVNFIEEQTLDGIVLEVWSQIGGNYKMELAGLIKELGEAMMSRKQKLILVIPPPMASMESPGMFTKDDFDLLAPIVDGFSLMTYDYPNYGSPGPVAPYNWIKQCVETLVPDKNLFRQKILLGLNFYGYSYNGRSQTPIVGNTFLEILEEHKPSIKWLKDGREHKFEYRDDSKKKTTVFFPTLQSINERIELARELGTGISIWEIGQGLDYFYDLL